MGRRQYRIPQEQLNEKLNDLVGKKFTLVSKDNSSFFVKLLEIQDRKILIEDMILGKHTIPKDQISEIILDF
ncbi:hypothetical protein [Xanthovirga aplysinae]|uniref:hypothetical protein n=1 Tax=Xanthovirga aplysinae TaxID=2529853 RepID=UPI0012BC6A7A|nr:hypothetical protein [Xanthovirga aplysinae]MTI31811.1 hypothetical protein [Xanthovirga aplysinae]